MKKALCLLALTLASTVATAQYMNSDANQFAMQAGSIAGAAQACGQELGLYNTRVNAVINALGKNSGDRQNALTIYQQALSNAQYTQNKKQIFNCSEVINSFQSLPLMRPDFAQTVLPKMAQMGTNNNAGPTNTSPAITGNNRLSPTTNTMNLPSSSQPAPFSSSPNGAPLQSISPGNTGTALSSSPGNAQIMVTGNQG